MSDESTRTKSSVAPARRGPSIPDLPVEVLTLIVKMCRRELGYGSSMNALLQTCKVLSKIAKPFIFHTLKVSRAVDSDIYHYYIAPAYLDHFSHVVLDLENKPGLSGLIASLDRCTRLDEITLTSPCAQIAFGSSAFSGHDQSTPATDQWRKVATRIRTLHPFKFKADIAARYLKISPHVTDLHYAAKQEISSPDAATFVKSLSRLKHLHLEIGEDLSVPSVTDTLVATSRKWPPLKDFTLTVPHIDGNTLQLLKRFKATLETLKIHVTDIDYEWAEESWLEATDQFPALRSITIQGGGLIARRFFVNSERHHFPALTHVNVHYDLNDESNYAFGDDLVDWILEEHAIKRFEYFPCDPFSIGSTAKKWLAARAREHNARIDTLQCPETSIPSDIFFSDPPYNPYYSEDDGREEVKKSLKLLNEHWSRRYEQADQADDGGELHRLAI
ncbi:hypothetical protein JCM16303_004606 [Sporobolomyces ruberrimus]